MGKSAIQIKFVGDFDAIVEQFDGTKKRATIKDIRVAPDAGCNLLSLTKLLKQGYKLYGDNEGLEASKGSFSIKFDQIVDAGSGYLLGI